MAGPSSSADRPLSPHLQVYKPLFTMVMSIMHRITGSALYFGTALVAWWFIATANGEASYETVSGIFGSIPGRLVLFGYTWALFHHMLGGIRHLIWDTGAALDKTSIEVAAWLTIISSVVLTILIWVAGFGLMGGQ